ncbi:MAG TPA: cadherin domain-containing protein, partial [Bradyrhizobium sp.]|nr:cadherin domain-containing protein [Bradyrhizobium sp.]
MGPTPVGDVASADGGVDPDPDLLAAQFGGQPSELASIGVPNGEVIRSYDSGGHFYSQSANEFDDTNARIWDERDLTTNSTGKVTNVQVKLNGETQTRSAANPADYSAIGQIFGSAIGRAIVGKDGNPFVSLTVGTVAGFVGQKFVQALTNGPGAIDLAQVDLGDVFFGQGVSLAGAGLGAASSFLTAEIATSIGLNGVGAQMFNAAVGGYLGSVLNQVRAQGFNVLTAVVDWNVALHASEVNIATTIGSLLAHQFHPAESQFGAVGGQLAGAVGSALAYSFSLGLGQVLNVFLPGVGAFFGTIIGTIIGDVIAGDPVYPMAYHDVEIIGSDPTHFQNRLVGTDNHGNAAISEEMGDQVTRIANSYLDAVHGAGISYSGKVMIGYNAGAAPYQYITGWFPDGINGPSAHFATATDAIQEGVRELLMNTEVLGGDLLVKRAHQVFINGHHAAPTEIASDFTDLASLGGDLRTAQDYQQYLNDRETINALIQLYPNSAFTAGWAATFARVKELGLDHVRGSDFNGGLVGWLDSVAKAGLGAEAANAIVKRGSDNSVIVEVKVANGAEVPGALSVFADRMTVTSDASGQTLQFTVDNGLGMSGTLLLGPGTGSAGHDIMVGGAADDVFTAGAGWDFVDGGAGSDYLFGQDGSDILRGGRGNDFLFGGQGDDTYVFTRGDGVDVVYDEYHVVHTYTEAEIQLYIFYFGHPPDPNEPVNAGSDTLVFGPGIAKSDIAVQRTGNDLIVGVKDPAHPGAQPTDWITLKDWAIAFNRIETFGFADGTTLNLSGGDASLAAYLVPFGETLSRSSVAENSPIGTVVGTVAGFDFAAVSLSYSLASDPSGCFAINASTGVITTTVPLDYETNAAHSWQIKVRISDGAHVFDQPFTINVTDVNEAPTDITLSGNSVVENSPNGRPVGTAV